jgi:hypothetical protein
MHGLDERVPHLEGRFDEHTVAIDAIRADIRELRVDVRDMRAEIGDLRKEMYQGFRWLAGIQIAVLISVVGALVGSYFR